MNISVKGRVNIVIILAVFLLITLGNTATVHATKSTTQSPAYFTKVHSVKYVGDVHKGSKVYLKEVKFTSRST